MTLVERVGSESHRTLRHAFNGDLWDAVQPRIGKAVCPRVQNDIWRSTIDLFLTEPFERGGALTLTSMLAREIER